jgi:hypothetical protein
MNKRECLKFFKTLKKQRAKVRSLRALEKKLQALTKSRYALESDIRRLEGYEIFEGGLVSARSGFMRRIDSPHEMRYAEYWQNVHDHKEWRVTLYDRVGLSASAHRVGHIWFSGSKKKILEIGKRWVVLKEIPPYAEFCFDTDDGKLYRLNPLLDGNELVTIRVKDTLAYIYPSDYSGKVAADSKPLFQGNAQPKKLLIQIGYNV